MEGIFYDPVTTRIMLGFSGGDTDYDFIKERNPSWIFLSGNYSKMTHVVNGVPVETPEVADVSIVWKYIKYERDRKLRDCDWVLLDDAPVTDKQAWKNYRKALRDFTLTCSDPYHPVWPTAPPIV